MNEIPEWSEVEALPEFATLTPSEKLESYDQWERDYAGSREGIDLKPEDLFNFELSSVLTRKQLAGETIDEDGAYALKRDLGKKYTFDPASEASPQELYDDTLFGASLSTLTDPRERLFAKSTRNLRRRAYENQLMADLAAESGDLSALTGRSLQNPFVDTDWKDFKLVDDGATVRAVVGSDATSASRSRDVTEWARKAKAAGADPNAIFEDFKTRSAWGDIGDKGNLFRVGREGDLVINPAAGVDLYDENRVSSELESLHLAKEDRQRADANVKATRAAVAGSVVSSLESLSGWNGNLITSPTSDIAEAVGLKSDFKAFRAANDGKFKDDDELVSAYMKQVKGRAKPLRWLDTLITGARSGIEQFQVGLAESFLGLGSVAGIDAASYGLQHTQQTMRDLQAGLQPTGGDTIAGLTKAAGDVGVMLATGGTASSFARGSGLATSIARKQAINALAKTGGKELATDIVTKSPLLLAQNASQLATRIGQVTGYGTAMMQSGAGTYAESFNSNLNKFRAAGLPEEKALDEARTAAALDGATASLITGAMMKVIPGGVESVLGKKLAENPAGVTLRSLVKDVSGNGLKAAMKDAAWRQGFANVAVSLGKEAGAEALEEGADEALNGLYASARYNPDMTFSQWIDQVGSAALLGGILGGGVNAAMPGRRPMAATTPATTTTTVDTSTQAPASQVQAEPEQLPTEEEIADEMAKVELEATAAKLEEQGAPESAAALREVAAAPVEETTPEPTQIDEPLPQEEPVSPEPEIRQDLPVQRDVPVLQEQPAALDPAPEPESEPEPVRVPEPGDTVFLSLGFGEPEAVTLVSRSGDGVTVRDADGTEIEYNRADITDAAGNPLPPAEVAPADTAATAQDTPAPEPEQPGMAPAPEPPAVEDEAPAPTEDFIPAPVRQPIEVSKVKVPYFSINDRVSYLKDGVTGDAQFTNDPMITMAQVINGERIPVPRGVDLNPAIIVRKGEVAEVVHPLAEVGRVTKADTFADVEARYYQNPEVQERSRRAAEGGNAETGERKATARKRQQEAEVARNDVDAQAAINGLKLKTEMMQFERDNPNLAPAVRDTIFDTAIAIWEAALGKWVAKGKPEGKRPAFSVSLKRARSEQLGRLKRISLVEGGTAAPVTSIDALPVSQPDVDAPIADAAAQDEGSVGARENETGETADAVDAGTVKGLTAARRLVIDLDIVSEEELADGGEDALIPAVQELSLVIDRVHKGQTTKAAEGTPERLLLDKLTKGGEDGKRIAQLVKDFIPTHNAIQSRRFRSRSLTEGNPADALPHQQRMANRLGLPSGDIKAALNRILAMKDLPKRYRTVAKQLLKQLEGRMPAIQIVSTDAPYAGEYDPDNNVIVVNLATDNGRGVVDAFLHELVHAAEAQAIRNPQTPAEEARVSQLRKIREDLVAKQGQVLKRLDALEADIAKVFRLQPRDPAIKQLVHEVREDFMYALGKVQDEAGAWIDNPANSAEANRDLQELVTHLATEPFLRHVAGKMPGGFWSKVKAWLAPNKDTAEVLDLAETDPAEKHFNNVAKPGRPASWFDNGFPSEIPPVDGMGSRSVTSFPKLREVIGNLPPQPFDYPYKAGSSEASRLAIGQDYYDDLPTETEAFGVFKPEIVTLKHNRGSGGTEDRLFEHLVTHFDRVTPDNVNYIQAIPETLAEPQVMLRDDTTSRRLYGKVYAAPKGDKILHLVLVESDPKRAAFVSGEKNYMLNQWAVRVSESDLASGKGPRQFDFPGNRYGSRAVEDASPLTSVLVGALTGETTAERTASGHLPGLVFGHRESGYGMTWGEVSVEDTNRQSGNNIGSRAATSFRRKLGRGVEEDAGWKASGLFGAGLWDKRAQELLTRKNNVEASAEDAANRFLTNVDRFVKKESKGNRTEEERLYKLVQDALGTTDNRVSEAQYDSAKANLKGAQSAARGNFMRGVQQATQLAKAGDPAAQQVLDDARDQFRDAMNYANFQYELELRNAHDANLAAFRQTQANALADINAVSPEMHERITAFRQRLDSLSAKIASFTGIDPDLAATIDENKGIYLHRGYRLFDDPKYRQDLADNHPRLAGVIGRAEIAIREQLIKEDSRQRRKEARDQMVKAHAAQHGIGEEQARFDLRNKPNPLDRVTADAQAAAYVNATPQLVRQRFNEEAKLTEGDTPQSRPKASSVDDEILKHRKDLPQWLRDLWGQYENPRVNAAHTLLELEGMVAQNDFLSRMRDLGQQPGKEFLAKKDPRTGLIGPIPGVDTSRWVPLVPEDQKRNPLSGYYGPEIVRDAFKEITDPKHHGFAYNALMKATGLAMSAKTKWSVQSHMRNFLGNTFFLAANDNLGLSTLGDVKSSFKTIMADVLQTPDKAKEAEIQKLIKLGVIHDNTFVELWKDLTQQTRNWDIAKTDAPSIFGQIGDRLKRISSGVGKAYQAEDDFWKVVAFKSERAKVEAAYPSYTDEQLDEEAAKRVRMTMPSYSKAPQIIRLLRKTGVLAPFVTFVGESIRTGANIFRLAIQDIKSGNPTLRRSGLARLAAVTAWQGAFPAMVSTLLPHVLKGLAQAMLGDDKEPADDNPLKTVIRKMANPASAEQVRALRRFLPSWMQDSQLYVLGTDPQTGHVAYADISYLNPYNYFPDIAIAAFRGFDQPDEELGKRLRDAAANSFRRTLEPFVGEQLIPGAFLDWYARDPESRDTDRRVFEADDVAALMKAFAFGEKSEGMGQAASLLEHLWSDAFQPGTWKTAQRIFKGTENKTDPGGRAYNTLFEIASAMGLTRLEEVNPSTIASRKMKERVRSLNSGASIFTNTLTNRGSVSDSAIRDSYLKANDRRRRAMADMRRDYRAALALGASANDVLDGARREHIGNDDLAQVVNNTYQRFVPGPTTIRAAAENKAASRDKQDRVRLLREVINNAPATLPLIDNE